MRMLRSTLVTLVLALACKAEESAPAPSGAGIPVADDLGAMTEYLRRSKAAEAKVNVAAIARGVASASENMRWGPDGTPTPPKLTSVGPTPPVGECCKQPQGKCTTDPSRWREPGWQAVFFELTDPHYYSYELVIEPTGFIARAIGDLDCDGELARFEVRGAARPDGSYEPGGTPTSDNPLE